MTSLSVIVISLNEGESLRRTVDNLLATLPDSSEIIVVDDGSTDRSTADVVNPDAILFGASQDRWVVPEVTTLKMLLQRNSVHCCSAFRRELWSRTGGIDEQMPCWMDYEFWIRLAAAGARIQGLHGDHFFHRRHGDSLSN